MEAFHWWPNSLSLQPSLANFKGALVVVWAPDLDKLISFSS